MPLLERVSTLLRANVNDLIDRAEDPEKMLKQLVLDMENQLLQVKTQVAIAIADEHLLEKKRSEHEAEIDRWKERASLAVSKGRDDLAREALDRSLRHTRLSEAFVQQINDQRAEAENLRSTFLKLQAKLAETRGRCDLLIAEHRRARVAGKATEARTAAGNGDPARAVESSIDRYSARTLALKSANHAAHLLENHESLEDRFALLEREQQIDSLLGEIKDEMKGKERALPEPATAK